MKKLSLLFSIFILISFTGCSSPSLSGEKVHKEYFTNGKVMSELIMDDDNPQNGIFKKYGYEGKVTSTVRLTNGVKNGVETWYDGKGREIRKIPYVNGSRHGIMKELYPNGNDMVSISYRYGKREGLAQTYNRDGSVNQQVMYKNGKIIN